MRDVNDPSHVRSLEAMVLANPQARAPRLRLAGALLDTGQFDESLRHVRVILSARPKDQEALGVGLMAAELLGDAEMAKTMSERLKAAQHAPEPRGVVDRMLTPVAPTAELVVPVMSLASVDGFTDEKRRFEQVLVRAFRQRGMAQTTSRLPSGLVLYGPEGSAKSQLAHAVAGELHLNLVRIDVREAVDPWGAANGGAITQAFALANEQAPCLLFLDNVEAAGHRRLRYTANGKEVVAELARCMQAHDPRRVIVVGATSAPWLLNATLKGAGLFDRFMLIGPPDLEARIVLMERSLRQRQIPCVADLRSVALACEGMNEQDIRSMVALAAEFALESSVDRGSVQPLNDDHFRKARGHARRSGAEWFDAAYNFPEFTDDSDQFDPLFDYIRRHVRKS